MRTGLEWLRGGVPASGGAHPQRRGNCNASAAGKNGQFPARGSKGPPVASARRECGTCSGSLLWDLGALFSCFGEAYGDGLLPAGDFSAFAAPTGAKRALLLAAHRAGNAFRGGLPVFPGSFSCGHTFLHSLEAKEQAQVGPRTMLFAERVPWTGYETNDPEARPHERISDSGAMLHF